MTTNLRDCRAWAPVLVRRCGSILGVFPADISLPQMRYSDASHRATGAKATQFQPKPRLCVNLCARMDLATERAPAGCVRMCTLLYMARHVKPKKRNTQNIMRRKEWRTCWSPAVETQPPQQGISIGCLSFCIEKDVRVTGQMRHGPACCFWFEPADKSLMSTAVLSSVSDIACSHQVLLLQPTDHICQCTLSLETVNNVNHEVARVSKALPSSQQRVIVHDSTEEAATSVQWAREHKLRIH